MLQIWRNVHVLLRAGEETAVTEWSHMRDGVFSGATRQNMVVGLKTWQKMKKIRLNTPGDRSDHYPNGNGGNE
jgi:hypothetical protein